MEQKFVAENVGVAELLVLNIRRVVNLFKDDFQGDEVVIKHCNVGNDEKLFHLNAILVLLRKHGDQVFVDRENIQFVCTQDAKHSSVKIEYAVNFQKVEGVKRIRRIHITNIFT